MALIDSVYYGYGTDTCLHYTLIDIMLQMTQVYIFDFVVQWSVSSFIELFLWDLLNFMKLIDACGFLLNDHWTEMKKCTIWAINI